MEDTALNNMKSEFRLWGVKPQINNLKSGHIELVWQATPDKPERRYIIAKTASDWRGWLNARSKIRQLFKQDNLKLVEIIKQPKPAAIVKALAIPEPVETDAQQIKLLRAEVADLSELMLNMMTMVKELIAVIPVPTLAPENAPPPAPPALPAPPVEQIAESIKAEFGYVTPVKTRAPNTKGIKAIDFLSTAWSSTDALARDMGLSPVVVKRKLLYLQEVKGLVEQQGDRWRKKLTEQELSLPIIAEKKRANGYHKQH